MLRIRPSDKRLFSPLKRQTLSFTPILYAKPSHLTSLLAKRVCFTSAVSPAPFLRYDKSSTPSLGNTSRRRKPTRLYMNAKKAKFLSTRLSNIFDSPGPLSTFPF